METFVFAPNASIHPDRIARVLDELDLYIEQKLHQFREQSQSESPPGRPLDEARQAGREERP